jgi:hypothetical protein
VFRNILLEPSGDEERIQPTQDFKVHLRHGNFFLILPQTQAPKKRKRVEDAEDVIALDPGVRTFMTGFSPEGTVEEIEVAASHRPQ